MKLSRKFIAFLLLLAGLVLVTFLAGQFPWRADLTAQNLYTLSPGTRSLLGKLEEPVTLQLYFSRSSKDIPLVYKNYATRVEEMLRQFASAAHGKVVLSVVDPRPDTEEDTAARRSGLSPKTLPNGDAVFFGLVATQAEQEQIIAFFDLVREPYLEYDIAKLVFGVQQLEKPRLGLLTGLPLRGSQFQMPGQPQEPSQVVVQEWENTFEVVSIEPTAETLPDNLDVLAVVHPQGVGDKLQFAIDQFLLAGKPVFIAVDPSSFTMRSQMQGQQQMMFGGQQPGVSSDLPKLFSAWGITYDANTVVGDLDLAMQRRTSQGMTAYPPWLNVGAAQLSRTALPTSSLQKLYLIEPGSVQVATDRGYEITPLIQTTERSGELPSMMLGFGAPAEVARQIKAGGVKKTLGVLVRGTFKTAFPDGAPKDEKKPDDATNPAEAKAEPNPAAESAAADATSDGATPAAGAPKTPPSLKESSTPGTLVVIADSDWLLDNTSLDSRFLGAGLAVPVNDNLALASNTMDFLNGSNDLISIRSKGTSVRPFEVIHRMENAAQEKYQAQAQELEKRLNDVQQEINKLVSNEAEGKRLIATPDVTEAIARYRTQEAEVRTQLRAIRLALREGIERLQNKITMLNLLAMPLAIGVAGAFFLIRRSRRQKSA